MVKTRRSNGENGEVDDGNYTLNDVGCVSDVKTPNWEQRELRSNQIKVTRKIQRWPKYNRRLRTIKMPRICFPESDTEPEKYSRRSRKVRVFFADGNESTNRSVRIQRSRGPRKNYMEDSEDKPNNMEQSIRRSCRKRKLLHHNFNESWITNELKVKGYPDLYGFPGSCSSDEFSSGDEARENGKKMPRNNAPTITDEDTQLSSRQRRTSARCNNTKKINDASESDSENENNQTVIEKKLTNDTHKDENNKMEIEDTPKEENDSTEEKKEKKVVAQPVQDQDSESNQAPARSTRGRGRRNKKKVDSQQDTASELSSTESGSELTLGRQPRRSNRTRPSKPAFVQIAPRETRGRAKTFTIRKKPYSLRERKPKILRRKTIRSQSPASSSSSSTTSSDTEEDLNVSMKNKTKGRQKSKSMDDKKTDRALRDIQPIELDGSIRFSSVGGLEEHIKCLREMVLFPLMYPDVFKKFNTRPAKGVLFHGPPGTGKTLLARALANECALVDGRKVAFFMRKGADCLKKWVGESERHLKLLFQQANKMKPSIIFFDEIDALAPVRSVRQEQVHTSVVGTLLAEMDGLCDRGEVVIIGATNRLDAVDPALRRAGRFDRELHFPAPGAAAREQILRIHTARWAPPPGDAALRHVADLTAGYGGADLRALCAEAVLRALRRVYPQVYDSEHALLIDTDNVEVRREDLERALGGVVAAGARASCQPARRLPARAAPLLGDQLAAASRLLRHADTSRSGEGRLSASALLVCGPCADALLAPALLAALERRAVRELSVAGLHAAHAHSHEHALISVFAECRRVERGCVLFARDLPAVWAALGGGAAGGGGGGAAGAGAALLRQLWRTRAAGDDTVMLATAAEPYDELPAELRELFPPHKDCVYAVREPSVAEVIAFLRPALLEAPLEPPPPHDTEPPPPLPRAPPPPPPRESAEEVARRKRKEDYKLRELRIFLRDICRKLASNRRFYKFTKPVDLEEVTDYLDIVKQPMDLETMMTKVDMHKYNCAKEFLDDIDLICANALEYNPDRTSSDKQIRHEACSLRDHAHALIDVEMDSDFELECREIARARRDHGAAPDNDLPDFIYTASNLPLINTTAEGVSPAPAPAVDGGRVAPASDTPHNGDSHSARRKRRRINAWSKGLVAKRPKTAQKSFKDTSGVTDEECKENKPITSTPLTNGASSSGSDDDAPLRPRLERSERAERTERSERSERADRAEHDALLAAAALNNHARDAPVKSTERSPTKSTSPKKRNSGHETSSAGADAEKVLINKTELENILYKNAKALRTIGLEPLLDLHSQITEAVESYSSKCDRTKLPQEIQTIVARYLQLAKK